MAMRAPAVSDAPTFTDDVSSLRTRYQEIDAAVEDFRKLLRLGYILPTLPVIANVYAMDADYPPLGAEGAGRFLVTFHVSEPAHNPMAEPYRRFTLLTIRERATT